MIPAGFPVSLAIRFYRASDAWMSPASGRNSAMIEIITPLRTDPFNTAKFGLGAYQAIFQSLVIGIIRLIRTRLITHSPLGFDSSDLQVENYGGRPHWGKNGLYYLSAPIIQKAISVTNRAQFISIMQKYDPSGIFQNKFGKRILNTSNEMDVDPKVTHCALQDYCICNVKSDCAVNEAQVCENVTTGNSSFPVCKDTKLYLNLPIPPYNPLDLLSILCAILNIINVPLLLL
jgi:L-gulonolactone oxidase